MVRRNFHGKIIHCQFSALVWEAVIAVVSQASARTTVAVPERRAPERLAYYTQGSPKEASPALPHHTHFQDSDLCPLLPLLTVPSALSSWRRGSALLLAMQSAPVDRRKAGKMKPH